MFKYVSWTIQGSVNLRCHEVINYLLRSSSFRTTVPAWSADWLCDLLSFMLEMWVFFRRKTLTYLSPKTLVNMQDAITPSLVFFKRDNKPSKESLKWYNVSLDDLKVICRKTENSYIETTCHNKTQLFYINNQSMLFLLQHCTSFFQARSFYQKCAYFILIPWIPTS